MNTSDAKGILKSMNMIYWAMFLGLLAPIFAMALISSELDTGIQDPSTANYIKTAFIALVIILIPLAFFIPQKIIRSIDPNLPLNQKLAQYRTAIILRLALLESAGFIMAVGFFLLKDTNLMLILSIILIVFIMVRPNVFKISSDLALNADDKEELMS